MLNVGEDKTADRSRFLAAAGVGGTESSLMEKRFKDGPWTISPSTNATG